MLIKRLLLLLLSFSILFVCGCYGEKDQKFGEEEVMIDINYMPLFSSENTSLDILMDNLMFQATINGREYNLPYRIYIPENYNSKYKYPLIVFFHGYGERGSNNTSQLSLDFDFLPRILNEENLKKYPSIIIAPQCPLDDVWATKGFETFNSGYDIETMKITKPMVATYNLINYLFEEYNVDKERLYVTGVSMGGLAAWDITARYPELIAACLPVCGAAMPIANPEKFQNINVWAFHGELDPTISVNTSKSMVNAINKNDGFAKITIYPTADHTMCWKYAFMEDDFLDFMFCSRRNIINKYYKEES